VSKNGPEANDVGGVVWGEWREAERVRANGVRAEDVRAIGVGGVA